MNEKDNKRDEVRSSLNLNETNLQKEITIIRKHKTNDILNLVESQVKKIT